MSITTDQGTERLLADLPDLLPAFYKHNGAALPKEVEFVERLFPHCLGSPGWNHVCDGLIQTGLNSLRLFPRCLDLLKSLNRVLRDHKEHQTEDLERNGLAGAATLVAQSSHPFFASWRWDTLADCCASIGKVLPTLKLNVHLLVSLSRARDKSLHEKAPWKRFGMLSRSPCFAVSVLLLLGASSCRSGGLAASVIVQSLNKANMLIVGRKGGC